MNSTTLKALDESIAHWERLASGKAPRFERPYSEHCALCREFLGDVGADWACEGCPVMDKTKQSHCKGSPWSVAETAFIGFGEDSPEFRTAAALELEFLKGLRPE